MSSPGISRSHFQAQQHLEKGGSDTATSGWLDRMLAQLGPGTTFRAVTEGSATPTALAGDAAVPDDGRAQQTSSFPAGTSYAKPSQDAVLALYRGIGGPLGEDVPDTIAALGTAAQIQRGTGDHRHLPQRIVRRGR